MWKNAILQVQDSNRSTATQASSLGNALSLEQLESTPSIIQERQLAASTTAATRPAPKLAVMVHAAYNLPGSNGSSKNSDGAAGAAHADAHQHSSTPAAPSSSKGASDCYYMRAGLAHSHSPLVPLQQQKTAPVMAADGHVCWPNGLLQLEPHSREVDGLEVVLQLKRRTRLTGSSVVVGSARVPLSEVMASPDKWGTKRQVQLSGHKAGAAATVLEVQLFLAMASVPHPLRVLCATWNVGNALPPPPEQLQGLFKGAAEGEHHLIAVAAQECNYFKEMRRYVSQHKRSMASAPSADGATLSTPPSARAAAAAAAAAFADHAAAGEDAPGTPNSEAGGLDEEQQGSFAAAAAGTGAGADTLLASHKLGSKRAALRAKLVDAVDSSAMWERHISSTLGDKYWLVGSEHMFQTCLLLFARADVVPSLSSISTSFEATGIGHVGVNKGGVAVGLQAGSTHIAFVGSHLAAHQSKTQIRNRDVREICRELDLRGAVAAAGADLVTGFHHVVWMGDLNYRLDYGQQATTQSESPTPEDFSSLCAAISERRFGELLPLDQLARERQAGHVFHGFCEGSIEFAPTFKVSKGQPGFSYAKKRSPAWCDRVLFKSALPHRQASCVSYYTVPDICTSDHKPVGAVLLLPMATHTVAAAHRALQSGASSPAAAASPPQASSASRSSPSSSSKALSPTHSWSAAAAARLSKLNLFSRRSTTGADTTLYKLYLASVALGDTETWEALAQLARDKPNSSDKSVGRTFSSSGGSSSSQPQVDRSSSGAGASSSGKCKLRLQLVVSGACMAGIRQQHVVRLDPAAVAAARTAEEQPSLLLREDSIQLLPGPLSQLTDDWLLVQLVLSEGWKSKKTLARGILPLHSVVAAFRSSYKAVPVSLQLEAVSAGVGSLVCHVQLISSASIRAGMHEAIRRMRKMAAETRSSSVSQEGIA